MPEAVQELDGRVAAERDETPEHERVRHAGDRPLRDRLALKRTSRTKPLDAEAEVVEGKGVGRGGDQPDARRHLRRERADERDEQQPEDERFHTTINAETAETAEKAFLCALCELCVHVVTLSAPSIIAGTISNRSPTMP